MGGGGGGEQGVIHLSEHPFLAGGGMGMGSSNTLDCT